MEAIAYVTDAADALAEELVDQGAIDEYLEDCIDITYALLGQSRDKRREIRHQEELER